MREVNLIELKNIRKEYELYKLELYSESENNIKEQLEQNIKDIPNLTEDEIKYLYSIYFKLNKLEINDKLFNTISIVKYNFDKNYYDNSFAQLDWVRIFGLELQTTQTYYPHLNDKRKKKIKILNMYYFYYT